jgi:hypothetical protein
LGSVLVVGVVEFRMLRTVRGCFGAGCVGVECEIVDMDMALEGVFLGTWCERSDLAV